MTSLESLEREADVVRKAIGVLQERLPAHWEVQAVFDVHADGRPDEVKIVLPHAGGAELRLLVEFKRNLVVQDLPAVVNQLERAKVTESGETVPVLVSRYLSPSVRNRLEHRRISYIDATGNLQLTSDDPLVFLRNRGDDRDPWRSPGRPRGTLRGLPPAASFVLSPTTVHRSRCGDSSSCQARPLARPTGCCSTSNKKR